MVLASRTFVTEAEFEQFTRLPENDDKLFELIGGEIIEVPSNPFASKVGYNLGIEVGMFNKIHRLGHVTGEAGGYMVAGERYAPDVAFISYTKQPELAHEGYNPNPPDLAVEFEYPTSLKTERQLRIKLANYLSVGTMVWVVYPDTFEIEVYVPGQPVRILGINDTLDGGTVLPGFTMAVRDVFAG